MYLKARLVEIRNTARLSKDTKLVTLTSTYLGEVENIAINKPNSDVDGELLRCLNKS
jgi:hypothetical protein